ncbi:MAG: hypothetical protein KI790_05405 [Cyclobacteriaceae bacterium]|nr:hypothetical protein [Cyclobacteriaceae bacterium HetDA_MAG_MS6]
MENIDQTFDEGSYPDLDDFFEETSVDFEEMDDAEDDDFYEKRNCIEGNLHKL